MNRIIIKEPSRSRMNRDRFRMIEIELEWTETDSEWTETDSEWIEGCEVGIGRWFES